MNTSWGTGNDYSMILHAVEDNIADVIDVSDSDDNDNGNSGNEDGSSDDEGNRSSGDERSQCQSVMTTSGTMQMEFQLDDLKLKNEELRDQLQAQKDSFKRDKDKYLRQLQFLESENEVAKKDLAARTDKYYDTKKKLQTVVRAAEAEKKKLMSQILQLSSKTSSEGQAPVPTSPGQSGRSTGRSCRKSDVHGEFDKSMIDLEKKVIEKSAEAKELQIRNAQLMEECGSLQQQLLVARSDSGNKEDLSSLRLLQTKVKDLEFALRHKNREFDKLEKSAKNSHILEEDLSTCNAKVQSLQESVKAYRAMEVEYNTLVQEKKGWTLHFRELLTTSDLHDFEDDKKKSMKEVDVTPVVILRLLSNMQNKCASLLHTSGTLENKISELTSAQRRAVLQVQQVELDLTEKTNKVLQLENSNALLRQQAKLYEGEVMSLRSLLKTFDAEMLMFGNKKKRSRTSIESVAEQGDDGESLSEVSVLLKLKNQEIENLQRELDQQRKDGAEVLKKLSADVGALSSKRLVEYGCMVLYVESMLSF
jgi:chromosome segregation ATPase